MEEAQRHKREALRKDGGEKSGKPEERGRKEHHLGSFSRYTPLRVWEISRYTCVKGRREKLKSRSSLFRISQCLRNFLSIIEIVIMIQVSAEC